MTTWTVLAPGPSLEDVSSIEADGPIVAVNYAVLSPIKCDFWCCLDSPLRDRPGELKFALERLAQAPLVWCPEGLQTIWRGQGFRTWPLPYSSTLSILAAVERCSELGASKIDVYGCDMTGSRHAYDIEREGSPLNGRWDAERKDWDRLMRRWDAAGVEVVRRA